jgi:hypothetical protein
MIQWEISNKEMIRIWVILYNNKFQIQTLIYRNIKLHCDIVIP